MCAKFDEDAHNNLVPFLLQGQSVTHVPYMYMYMMTKPCTEVLLYPLSYVLSSDNKHSESIGIYSGSSNSVPE